MGKETKTVFPIEDRYQRKLVKDIYLNIIIILVFYATFNLLFKDHPRYQSLIKYLLIVIFILAGVLIIFSDMLRIRKFQAICYRIKADGLEYCDGKRTKKYRWDSFQKVMYDPNKISLTYPCCFYTKEGNFFLHRRIADPDLLIPAIIAHVKDYAKIDPEIPKTLLPK